MKTFKTLTIVTILFFAFSFASNAQVLKHVKIKTSAQSELCKKTIENYLAYEKGIKDVELDLKSKIVTVKYSDKKTDYNQICEAITNLGYDADEKKADKDAYAKLPAECKKPLVKKSKCGSTYKSNCSNKCRSYKYTVSV